MPIVFEEVTGEIVPERETPEPAGAAPGASEPEALARRIRHEIRLLHEREHRLRAD